MKITVPFWLFKLIFGRRIPDLDKRSALTGKASATNKLGPIETTLTVERDE